eukprot:SAG22_NODE_78_length_22065_cov_7.473095_12_plen_255_part_00
MFERDVETRMLADFAKIARLQGLASGAALEIFPPVSNRCCSPSGFQRTDSILLAQPTCCPGALPDVLVATTGIHQRNYPVPPNSSMFVAGMAATLPVDNTHPNFVVSETLAGATNEAFMRSLEYATEVQQWIEWVAVHYGGGGGNGGGGGGGGGGTCMVWKANNVGGRTRDAPKAGPHYENWIYESTKPLGILDLMNRYTIPRMLAEGISVLDPTRLTIANRLARDVVHHTEMDDGNRFAVEMANGLARVCRGT